MKTRLSQPPAVPRPVRPPTPAEAAAARAKFEAVQDAFREALSDCHSVMSFQLKRQARCEVLARETKDPAQRHARLRVCREIERRARREQKICSDLAQETFTEIVVHEKRPVDLMAKSIAFRCGTKFPEPGEMLACQRGVDFVRVRLRQAGLSGRRRT